MCNKNTNDKKLIFLNKPISDIKADWIGVSSYVEKLQDAIEEGADMIAVLSDFGGGKSTLIELLEAKYKSIENGCCFYRVNLWSHLESKIDTSVEIHKAFLYQLISQMDHKKSSYISKRLNKNYGLFKISTEGKLNAFFIGTYGFFAFIYNDSRSFFGDGHRIRLRFDISN